MAEAFEDPDKPKISEQPEPNDEADKTPFDDSTTSEAIDDIVATEGDQVLQAEDSTKYSVQGPKHRWYHFLATSKGRWATLLVLAIAIGLLVGLPTTRYWMLNAYGVRVSTSVTTVDSATHSPLKNVKVTVAGRTVTTNGDGTAKLHGLKLGPATIRITQTGFATVSQDVVLGWGSNPLGTVALKSVGVRYELHLSDYLSGKAIAGAEASSGEATARSDSNGKLVLTLPSTAAATAPISVSKAGYRTEQVLLGDPSKSQNVHMVADAKALFMSKESGTYDVYRSDLDGKNTQVLLTGTGSETSQNALVVSPDGSHAALVSARTGEHASDGFVLNTLTIIATSDGSAISPAKAEQIQLIDWVGSRLIFEQVSPDASASGRYSIISYDVSSGSRIQLASASQLSAVFSVRGVVYYGLPADASAPGLYKINPDGSGKQQIFNQAVVSGLRSDYTTLDLQTPTGWYGYDVLSGNTVSLTSPAGINRLYVDNGKGTASLWVQSQGTFNLYDVASGKDSARGSQAGLTYPLRWATDSVIVYRVSTESADYAVSLEGGTPHKIATVTNTTGLGQNQ